VKDFRAAPVWAHVNDNNTQTAEGRMNNFDTSTTPTSQRAAYGLALPQSSLVLNRARGAAASPAQAVRAAARAISSSELQAVTRDGGVAMQPRAMLAVLSFCYAFEIYSSEEVEQVMCRDAEFRRLCANEFPNAQMLKRFRRYNRDAIERCLADVLRALAAENAARPSDADLRDDAHERVNTAILMDMHEN
jgi:hypothetical protein